MLERLPWACEVGFGSTESADARGPSCGATLCVRCAPRRSPRQGRRGEARPGRPQRWRWRSGASRFRLVGKATLIGFVAPHGPAGLVRRPGEQRLTSGLSTKTRASPETSGPSSTACSGTPSEASSTSLRRGLWTASAGACKTWWSPSANFGPPRSTSSSISRPSTSRPRERSRDVGMLSVFAKFERAMIQERVKAGLASGKGSWEDLGKTEGLNRRAGYPRGRPERAEHSQDGQVVRREPQVPEVDRLALEQIPQPP
jgi:hypothetical protein